MVHKKLMSNNAKMDISRKNLEAYIAYAENMLNKYTLLIQDLKTELHNIKKNDCEWHKLLNEKTKIFQNDIEEVTHTRDVLSPESNAPTYVECTEILFVNDKTITIETIGDKRHANVIYKTFSLNGISIDDEGKFIVPVSEILNEILSDFNHPKSDYENLVELINTIFDYYSMFECGWLQLKREK